MYPFVPRTLEETVDPSRTALVVYDMQKGILSQLRSGPAVLEGVLKVLDAARGAGVCVYFMRHMSLPKKLMGTFQMRQAMVWQRTEDPDAVNPWFLRGAPGFQLADELAVRDDEAIFDKLSMSAFEGTPLAFALRDKGLSSFVICGIATEIGIEPTVRHGSDLGLIPVVVEDACGAGHAGAGGRTMAQFRFMGDAVMTTIADVERVWRGA